MVCGVVPRMLGLSFRNLLLVLLEQSDQPGMATFHHLGLVLTNTYEIYSLEALWDKSPRN